MDRRRETGIKGENLAKSYLENLGFRLIARNYRCRLGEMDLVFQDRGQVVFVEVRTKTSQTFGSGLDSITFKKRLKLRTVAQHFLSTRRFAQVEDVDIRFDVISIHMPLQGPAVIEHVRGAF